jgi:8-oxo-dGTP diphosphatase
MPPSVAESGVVDHPETTRDSAGSAMTVVVAGAILGDGGDLLAARRSAPLLLAGGWELPGGKVEAGESDTVALRRELREELGVEVVVGAQVVGAHGGDWPMQPGYLLRAYVCTLVAGEPRPLEEHDELRWLAPSQWLSVDWLPADLPVVQALRRHV